jgi:glycine betaine/proline transport system ATP-binding protein
MTPTIAVHHLWKVFGPKPERIVGMSLAGLPPADLRAREHESTGKSWLP